MRCPDPPVHPAAAGVLRGPLLAAGWLAALALAVYAVGAMASFLAAVTAGILAVDAVVAWVLVRCLRYGGLRKPQVKARVIVVPQIGERNENRAALPAPPLAIEQARPRRDDVIIQSKEAVR